MFPVTEINIKVPGVVDKLMNLYTNLRERKTFYETVASRFKDKELERSVISLAQESNQYASEVCAQIHCMGGGIDYGCDPLAFTGKVLQEMSDKDNIGKICDSSEKEIVFLYRDILEDPFLFSGLKKMIEYQMKGFMYTISQLRLLQTSIY